MGIKTLIVDDDELTLFLHQVFINENKFNDTSITFSSGKDVVDYLIENHDEEEAFCVLLDLNMPLLNGWETLDAFMENAFVHKLKVVILTSSVNQSDRQKAKEYPQVITFLEKPLTNDKVEALKREVAFKKYYE